MISIEPDLETIVISNTTSLIVGDTVLLTCVGLGQPNVQITWNKNGEDIMNASLVTIYEQEVTREGRRFRQSFLELCGLESSQAGQYACIVNNGMTEFNFSVQVDVNFRGEC